ncbi:class I SAM-dependent methyltransferase [Dactylosporangium aurantiacum]|uniref:Class I SAM-dependent methyltransferase n=1 Tax=Dactylosporangium aurantiacum TaxID=35754 RepID=A0A9Q9MQJ2_9ACTN|nr:methyltransferase domain-containing protein [Dactylosporangium aurantiacum]MDG6103134.1 methyltransferase domain-containing protein [Dactylosporangium aurantiacum]UWZ57642.1 class I SAM-dependent methyltransferase [Dactylosporangium aurantiacum]
MGTNYAQVFQDTGAVDKYEHVTYAPGSYASRINERQRAYLRALVRRAFPAQRPVQHDFACGTGRAIRSLHGLVRQAHGYDTSTDMLAKAAEVGTRAQLHAVAADGPVPRPAPADGPALVTMFRLLLNVDDAVRDRALAFAALALPDAGAGLLVIENHGNARSLRHLRARRLRGQRWFAELSHDDVERLLRRHGFEIIERRGFSMLTQGWYERRGLDRIARGVDSAASVLPGTDRYAVNVVYVARRRPA